MQGGLMHVPAHYFTRYAIQNANKARLPLQPIDPRNYFFLPYTSMRLHSIYRNIAPWGRYINSA